MILPPSTTTTALPSPHVLSSHLEARLLGIVHLKTFTSNKKNPSLKHLEKICSVFEGHIISINFPPRNWEGYYAYSSRLEENYVYL
jgi:hypothetical protein